MERHGKIIEDYTGWDFRSFNEVTIGYIIGVF